MIQPDSDPFDIREIQPESERVDPGRQVAEDVVRELREQQEETPPRFRLNAPIWHVIRLKGDFKGAWVEMRMNPSNGFLLDLGTGVGIRRLHEVIRSWNLEDHEGEPLEVTVGAVGDLEPPLVKEILDRWNEERNLSKRR